MGVIPIINENDSISVKEIKFGDNDTLSAIAAGMVKADYLFLMTDVDCLYTDNPKTNPAARPVLVCDDIDALKQQVKFNTPGSKLGTGGMITKLVAADLATAAGVTTVIARGATPEKIISIIDSKNDSPPLHTRFVAKPKPLMDRKWWILHGLHAHGTVYVEEDMADHIHDGQVDDDLFAHSIAKVEGEFVEHQAVRLVVQHKDSKGLVDNVTIAKGIVNYSSAEIMRIMLAEKSHLVDSLGYKDANCVINRDNMAISV